MGIHAWIDHIHLRITHANARRMLTSLETSGLISEHVTSTKDYLVANYCEVTSDHHRMTITGINFDRYSQNLYEFLKALEDYVDDGGFIRFSNEGGGWSIVLYENRKLLAHGDLADFQKPDLELEISKEWGDRGHDGNTYVHDKRATDEKLHDHRYWMYGCRSMATRLAHLGLRLAPLKSINKKLVEDLHSFCVLSSSFLDGTSTLTKDQVNSLKQDAAYVSGNLKEVADKIENRPDASELLITRQRS